jgi:signal transduction histidine kinase
MAETILIVDDTPANLGVLVETLGAADYRLMVAEDGEEALAQTARSVPDIILLDVMMPGIDGFETCRRLKADPRTRDVPVLFMTALSETADKVKAFAAGGVDYITKPIQHEEALARVRTHLQLRRLQRELAEQLATKERFMRIAGHDLRSPLCLIMMAATMARREGTASPATARCLDQISDAAALMRRVIDTFLDLRAAPSAAGRVDLNLVAAAVLRLNESAAERKQITLQTDFAEPLPPACGDASLAYQALVNFVTNAVKFSPPGGSVSVRTRTRGDRVRVSVIDSGPGVPVAERAQLFREDVQLSPRPTGGEESHGLGLAIVKHLVEAQDGSVGADFPAGGGSVFWFELPGDSAVARQGRALKVTKS